MKDMRVDRRSFLQRLMAWFALAGSSGALLGLSGCAPAKPDRLVVAHRDELAPGQAKAFTLGGEPGILVHTREGQYLAFNATCTHMACTIVFDETQQEFRCPCHGGVYRPDGRVRSGPPPTPLAAFRVEVADDGQVHVF